MLIKYGETVIQIIYIFCQNLLNIQQNYIFVKMEKLFLVLLLVIGIHSMCLHEELASNTTKHFYNDLGERFLQSSTPGPLRLFVDYTQMQSGGSTEKNVIKRLLNITAQYFYNFLEVPRLNTLLYPPGSLACNILTVPVEYQTVGAVGDVGVVVGNQFSPIQYIAKSTSCAYLQSNNRPIWGMIMFNNDQFSSRYDQDGIQELVYVTIHELTHILAFSPLLYPLFPTGNPLQEIDGLYYLSSPQIDAAVDYHYGCASNDGMMLEDQDGTLVSAHWEKHHVGVELMIATIKKGAFMSNITAALFQTTGWYTSVNTSYVEGNTFGLRKGCGFLDIDNCDFDEFCTGNGFDCDWEGTGIGRCGNDPLSGSCSVYRYFTNTICIDQLYELKNLNSGLMAFERGGHQARCFRSDFRQTSLQPNLLNNRCYLSVCSYTGAYIYILVGSYILVCSYADQVLGGIPGLDGTLTCPTFFDNQCQSKQPCLYNCNKNGVCIDGRCLCTNSLTFSDTCLDVMLDQVQNPLPTGGRLMMDILRPIIEQESLNFMCFEGTVMNPVDGECRLCDQVYGCANCTQHGCIL